MRLAWSAATFASQVPWNGQSNQDIEEHVLAGARLSDLVRRPVAAAAKAGCGRLRLIPWQRPRTLVGGVGRGGAAPPQDVVSDDSILLTLKAVIDSGLQNAPGQRPTAAVIHDRLANFIRELIAASN